MKVPIVPQPAGPSSQFDDNAFEPLEAMVMKVANNRSRTCLVVEDDGALRHLVTDFLEDHGVRSISASHRDEAVELLERDRPDLVVLDRMLGEKDGLDLLREIRATSNIPVIITTGHRGNEYDRILGLELGADDYMTKPFGLMELLARIRALLRRRELVTHLEARRDPEKGHYHFGSWQLNRKVRRLTDSNGELVTLTKREYALLIAFLDAPQRPLTREYLLDATRLHEDVFDRSIDVQVLRLRRKLETNPNSPAIISTVRGLGYLFTLCVELVNRRP
jgi:two-component system, OmpR family, response regulator